MKMFKSLGKVVSKNAIPFTCLMMLPLFAYAADPEQLPSLGAILMAIWAGIQAHADTAVIMVPIIQLLRTHEVIGILKPLAGKYLQVAIAVICMAGFVVEAKAKGQSWGSALIAGLFTSGGAMKIYDAFRSINAPQATA